MSIHPVRLGEPMIEIHQHAVAIANGAIHLFFDTAAGSQGSLRGYNLAGAEPSGEHVEKMNSVFNEDSAAFGPIPKPMFRSE